MGHPDFRVSGKIFATLGYPGCSWGVAMLAPDQQAYFARADPAALERLAGLALAASVRYRRIAFAIGQRVTSAARAPMIGQRWIGALRRRM